MSPKGLSCFQGTLPELPKQEIVNTTMYYSHVLNCGGKGGHSPANQLGFGAESGGMRVE